MCDVLRDLVLFVQFKKRQPLWVSKKMSQQNLLEGLFYCFTNF